MCGHQCPSICGETCPEGWCQACGDHPTARVDLLLFNEYKDIDLDDTPVIVLNCGHFFTAESLDGMVGMSKVYVSDPRTGAFTDICVSPEKVTVPRCPDCKQPIRQFATKRYGRVVNQAVIDETSNKFHIEGLRKLAELETQLQAVVDVFQGDRTGDERSVRTRDAEANNLRRAIDGFCQKVSVGQQPTKKLFDAAHLAFRRRQVADIESMLEGLSLDGPDSGALLPAPILDRQIILSGQHLKVRLQNVILGHQFLKASRQTAPSVDSGLSESLLKNLFKRAVAFLKDCQAFIDESRTENLPRLAVHGIVAFARVAKCLESARSRLSTAKVASVTSVIATHIDTARELLKEAECLCGIPFPGSEEVRAEMAQIIRLYERERYEDVTAEEIASIKKAMVGGPGGFATNTGHWYKCQNGHSVSCLP